MNRRGFFKTLFAVAAGVVAAKLPVASAFTPVAELPAPQPLEPIMEIGNASEDILRGMHAIVIDPAFGVHPERFHDEYVRVTVLRNAREAQQKWLAAYIAPNRSQRGV